ncbi:chemotaxis protein CheA [Sphingomonas nostoxanthinifaciens]|uniref:chemotaxis protein CheA n=1 Tax=Sphingomonas nostoxanthinifaciens TaxID=2872652 RepID=UPI001CC1C9A4|nr:chemotaxis protein CheW [Sphingomonas nostoxanthinifaciens]UAK24280.1 chemotaxis protein CheW [Sphingomonas nostoxanthinifaciens]
MDELLAQFLIEGRELVAAANDALGLLARRADDRDAIDAAFRAVHTLKGSVAVFDMAPAGRILHEAESMLDRARKDGAAIPPDGLAALVACIDRVDAWIDAMERTGTLPADAGDVADRLLGGIADAPTPEAMSQPDWLAPLAEREADLLQAAGAALVAFRYRPDADCFFRGDDPLALCASVPDLQALQITPREPWPDPEQIEPFQCNLCIEGLSGASLDAVRAHFRLVSDQVALHLVRPQADAEAPVADAQSQTLRVDMRRIDDLADTLGELIVAANALEPLVAEVSRLDASLGARLRVAHGNVEREVSVLQRGVLAVRLVPIAPMLRRLPRIVRELAAELGKTIDFAIDGDSLEVDKAIADALFEPLLHLVRNAVDHGIEPADARVAAGKSPSGRLRLSFARNGERLDVALADDGRGIAPAQMRGIAVARGIVSDAQAAGLDDRAAIELIFAPGFSSADAVTSVSGRGVGMDAVRSALDRIDARIAIDSEVGRGTMMRLSFPLRAITTRMLVIRSGPDRYAVPFDKVTETVIVPAAAVAPLGSGEALVLRDRSVPLLHMAELLGGRRRASGDLRLMVADHGSERVAFVVDGFDQQINATVRQATGLLGTIPGVAGTAVLGDGEVLIVLDPERLIA